MAKQNEHIVFTKQTATGRKYGSDPYRRVTFGVYLDLEQLAHLAIKASHNKSRKGKDGPVYVEIHSVEDLPR